MLNIFKPQVPTDFELVELENVCRICFHSNYTTSLLSFNNEIESIISEFLPQKLNQKPLNPHQICVKCFEEAKIAYIFKKQCQFSEELITAMLNEHEPNVSETYEKETQTDFKSFILYTCKECEKSSFSNGLQLTNDCDKSKIDVEPIREVNSEFDSTFEDCFKTDYEHDENVVEMYENKNKIDVEPICEVNSELGSVFEDNLKSDSEHNENAVEMYEDGVFVEEIIDVTIEKLFENDLKVEEEIIEPVITEPKKKGELNSNPKRFDCTMCSKIFFKKDHLQTHVDSIHIGLSSFECTTSQQKNHFSLNNSRLTCSTEMKMQGKSFSCQICKRKFSTEKHLQNHEAVQHDEIKEFQCLYCSEKIIGATEYKKHCSVHHPATQKKRICPECGVSFSKNHIAIHIRRHTGEKPYKCRYCERTFVCVSEQKDHERVHTGEKNHHCTVCSKTFPRANRLKSHMRTHTNERPYKCSYCPMAFKENVALKQHRRQHTGERSECDLCSSSFVLQRELKKHKQNIHGVNVASRPKKQVSKAKNGNSAPAKLHFCSECGASFTKAQYLSIHIKRHTGEKPYKCEYCDRAFVTSAERYDHNKFHTGEKNYLCTNCPKAFYTNSKLRVHMRTHTGERPYKCLYCPKAFAQKGDLKAHHRRHTGERFYCDLCDAGFVQMYVLRKHKRQVHGIDVPISRVSLLLDNREKQATEEQTIVSSSIRKK